MHNYTKDKIIGFCSRNRNHLFLMLFMLIIMFINPDIFLIILFITLEFFSTWFEMNFKIEPGPDFIMCGIIFFSYIGKIPHAIFLMPFILISKLIFARFKTRHLAKPLIYLAVSFLAYSLRSLDIAILALLLSIFRYLTEYIFEFAMSKTISFDRLIPRTLRVVFTYLFFMLFSSILLKLA
ncbi:MAG: hypothetical protein NDI94_00935 [Candidatus Woesearchaeota archaeon]|nr:hypothetical protein [Candidatus Woesearchaeota archaeon]